MNVNLAQRRQQTKGMLVDSKETEALLNFQKVLNSEPPEREIKVNAFAGNSKYLPISFVEMKLDELFFGLWKTVNFRWQVVANEIIGTLELHVFHPVLQDWIVREGAASVLIQQVSKEKGGSGDITRIQDKIPNTLVKDFPHLKASCISNAAKTLGKIFGRDLNRTDEDSFTPITHTLDFEPYKVRLMTAKTPQDIVALLEEVPELQQNLAVVDFLIGNIKQPEDLGKMYLAIPYWKNNNDIVAKIANRKAALLKLQKGRR